MPQQPEIVKGLKIPTSFNLPNNPTLLAGTEDPTTLGVRGNIGSLFVRTNTGQLYRKTTALSTGWVEVTATAAGDVQSVTFSPGNPSPNPNEFTSWAAAHAAVASLGGLRSIVIDDSFVSPAVIPAGAYDMENISLVAGLGPTQSPITALQISDGVTMPNLRHIQGPMTIDSISTAAVVAPTDTIDGIIMENTVILTVTALGAPFFAVPTAVAYEISLMNGSQLVNTAALEIVSVVAGGTVTVRINGQSSSFGMDVLSGAGGTLIPIIEVGNPQGVSETQTNFAGTTAGTIYTAIPVWDLQGDSVAPVTTTTTGRPFERIYYDASGGTFTLNAPASPIAGTRWGVKNVNSDATAITISGNGNSIEDPLASFALAASFTLGSDGVSVTWEFDGNNWLVV